MRRRMIRGSGNEWTNPAKAVFCIAKKASGDSNGGLILRKEITGSAWIQITSDARSKISS